MAEFNPNKYKNSRSFLDLSLPRGDREDLEDDVELEYGDETETTAETPKAEPPKQEEKKTLVQRKIEETSTKAPKEPKIILPIALNTQYYEAGYEKSIKERPYDRANHNYWKELERYSATVRYLYSLALKILYDKSEKRAKLPDFVKYDIENERLGMDDIKLYLTQEELTVQAIHNDHKSLMTLLNQKKSSRMQELRDYVLKSFLIFDDLENNKYLRGMVNMQCRYEAIDRKDENSVVDFYVRHCYAKDLVFKDFFRLLENNVPKRSKYAGTFVHQAPVRQIVEDLLEEIHAYNPHTANKEIQILASKVKSPKLRQIVEYYNNYTDMKNVIRALEYLDESVLFPFSYVGTEIDRDSFTDAIKYLEESIKMKQCATGEEPFNQLILRDMNYFIPKLQSLLNKRAKRYKDCGLFGATQALQKLKSLNLYINKQKKIEEESQD